MVLDELPKVKAASVAFLAAPMVSGPIEVLLVKRAPTEKNYAGFWSFPGGGVDAGETPEEAAVRECREEIGHAPSDGENDLEWLMDTDIEGGRHQTFTAFSDDRFEPKLNAEHTDFKWVPLAKHPEGDVHPGVVKAMIRLMDEVTGDAWEEGKHPRAANGQFGSGGGSSGKTGEAGGSKSGTAPTGPSGLSNHSTEKMREYTPKELDWEFKTEYGKYSKSFAPNAFKSREDFQAKYDATPLTHLDQTQLDNLTNTMGLKGMAEGKYTKEQKLAYADELMGYRRDVKRIADELENGKTAPPIILKKDDQLRLMAGNTRLMTGAALGLNVPVKIIDVSSTDGKKKDMTKDEKPWFIFLGGVQHGPFPSREVATAVSGYIPLPLPPAMALDASVRTYDIDGRLKVANSHISKAMISPYLGSEIPGCNELGLDPKKVYQLLRDPAELQKAAPTFNDIPIMLKHVEDSAADAKRDVWVGTTGSNAAFDGTYLNNSLAIWHGDGIKVIEDEKQKELSCGYRYTPDMTPGVWQGQKYDGVMRNIIGNHVALVEQGRAGPDVMVGDHLPKELQMPKATINLPSRTALRVAGALAAAFGPRLAVDAKPDFSKALEGVTYKTFVGNKETKQKIIKLAKDAIDPSMLTPEAAAAGGAGPDDVIMRVLDMVEGSLGQAQATVQQAEQQIDVPGAVPAPAPAPAPGPQPALATEPSSATPPGEEDDDEDEKKKARDSMKDALLKKGLSEDDAEEICNIGHPKAKDAADPAIQPTGTSMDKKAMDAALKTHGAEVEARVRASMRDTLAAREFVKPWVGDVSMALDSATDIYTHTAKALKLGIDGLEDNAAALKAIIAASPKPVAKRPGEPENVIALDSARAASLAERFPHAAKIRGVN